MNKERVLPIQRIPKELWQSSILRLPNLLVTSYEAELNRLGLRKRSIENVHQPVHGGSTTAETHDHFAWRFVASAGRVEYTVLAPTDEFSHLSDAFLTTFSEGRIALLDIPCGTGAMSASLICTLAQLRHSKVMPRLPLTITICAGDFSNHAIEIYSKMLDPIVVAAASEGITIKWVTQEWNATRGDQTAALVDRWFDVAKDATEHLVAICNFSGALGNSGQFNAFAPCFEQILARLHDKLATVVWLEPTTNTARKSVFKRVAELVARRISWFSNATNAAPKANSSANYTILNPLTGAAFQSNVLVQGFKRT